jgi:hypothetical protein
METQKINFETHTILPGASTPLAMSDDLLDIK